MRQFKSLVGADGAPTACLGTIMRDGPMRVSAVATELGLDISTASRHVSHLESAGLLARQPDPADQRAALLTLTPEGAARLRESMQRRSAALRAATASWPEGDLATLTTLVNRLADDLGALAAAKED